MTPWRCWHELHASRGGVSEGYGAAMGKLMVFSRSSGLGVNEIDLWCRNQGLGARQAAFVRHLVIAMDRVFLDIQKTQLGDKIQSFFV